MKYFLLVFALTLLCFLTAKSQDTVRSAVPRTHPRHTSFIEMLHPNRDSLVYQHHYQDSLEDSNHPEHHHPTLYLDFGFGESFGIDGLQGNCSLNYQYERSLFTFRGIGIETFQSKNGDPFYFIIPSASGSLTQYALLYGWRFTNHRNHGYSFSLGISTNDRFFYYNAANQRVHIEQYYAGLPFEANYQWYTRRFGVSGGFKLSGDISRHSFVGIGVDMGLGFHNTHKH